VPDDKDTYLTDDLCRLLATDIRFQARFQQLKNYSRQVVDADNAIRSGSCQSCHSNIVKHTDIWAGIRAKVNGFPVLDKRDLLRMLGVETLVIPLGGLFKKIHSAPPPS